MTSEEKFVFLLQAVQTLSTLHEEKIVHGNVSPMTFIVKEQNKFDLLIDVLSSNNPKPFKSNLGVDVFASPETHLGGKNIPSMHDDMFRLGVVMWWLCNYKPGTPLPDKFKEGFPPSSENGWINFIYDIDHPYANKGFKGESDFSTEVKANFNINKIREFDAENCSDGWVLKDGTIIPSADIIKKMLLTNPDKRITSGDLMKELNGTGSKPSPPIDPTKPVPTKPDPTDPTKPVATGQGSPVGTGQGSPVGTGQGSPVATGQGGDNDGASTDSDKSSIFDKYFGISFWIGLAVGGTLGFSIGLVVLWKNNICCAKNIYAS
eukprot:GHVR01077280.1.p1 GENE.GHVR01077280.1~~GHVR01077280.1.p1  ORF type:complete len:320 (+),score=73.78 GHVR01077280.1:484-1443(+)